MRTLSQKRDCAHSGVFPSRHARRSWITGFALAILVTSGAAAQPIQSKFFIRADSNSDGELELGDAFRTLNFLFADGRAPSCLKAADVDDSGELELTDAVALLGFLFLGDRPPASPHLVCGLDLVADNLSCANTSCASASAQSFAGYQIFRNGTECRSEPCFDRTARASLTREEIPISSINFDHFIDDSSPPPNEDAIGSALLLTGPIQEGPREAGGLGRTLIALTQITFGGAIAGDLHIKSISTGTPFTPLIFPPRDVVPVEVVVEELGLGVDTPFDVQLSMGGEVVREWTLPGLGHHQSATLEGGISFFNGLPNAVFLTAVVDSANTVDENLESNNERRVLKSLLTAPPVGPVAPGGRGGPVAGPPGGPVAGQLTPSAKRRPDCPSVGRVIDQQSVVTGSRTDQVRITIAVKVAQENLLG